MFFLVCVYLSAARVWLPNLGSINYIYSALCLYRYISQYKITLFNKMWWNFKTISPKGNVWMYLMDLIQQWSSEKVRCQATVQPLPQVTISWGKFAFFWCVGVCACVCLFSCAYLKAAAGLKSLHLLLESLVYMSTGEDLKQNFQPPPPKLFSTSICLWLLLSS